MRQFKLCIASPFFSPIYSGPGLRFKRYLPGFKARGISTEVFSRTPSLGKLKTSEQKVFWDGYAQGEMLPVNIVNDTRVHRVCLPNDTPGKNSKKYYQKLVHFYQHGDFYPDLIQFLSLPLGAIPSLLKLRKAGVPTVFTHTLLSNLSVNPLKRLLQRFYWRFPFELVDVIVVSSSVMRAKLQQDLHLKTTIEIIPNGVNLSRFRPANNPDERNRIRRELEIPENVPVVVSVGPICPRKGQDLLLEAWGQFILHHPKSHLLLVGPRDDLAFSHLSDFHQTIQSLMQGMNKPENIHFVGPVTNVQEYLRTSDIFVFASQREGMPNVIPEAMGVGLPVITTPFVGLPDEFGQPGKHFLLVKRDARQLAGLLSKLLDQNELRHEIGNAGKHWIQQTMDVEHSINRYVNLYHSLL